MMIEYGHKSDPVGFVENGRGHEIFKARTIAVSMLANTMVETRVNIGK
jgi:hypothetical protein